MNFFLGVYRIFVYCLSGRVKGPSCFRSCFPKLADFQHLRVLKFPLRRRMLPGRLQIFVQPLELSLWGQPGDSVCKLPVLPCCFCGGYVVAAWSAQGSRRRTAELTCRRSAIKQWALTALLREQAIGQHFKSKLLAQ